MFVYSNLALGAWPCTNVRSAPVTFRSRCLDDARKSAPTSLALYASDFSPLHSSLHSKLTKLSLCLLLFRLSTELESTPGLAMDWGSILTPWEITTILSVWNAGSSTTHLAVASSPVRLMWTRRTSCDDSTRQLFTESQGPGSDCQSTLCPSSIQLLGSNFSPLSSIPTTLHMAALNAIKTKRPPPLPVEAKTARQTKLFGRSILTGAAATTV